MPTTRLALIVVSIALLAAGAWWWQTSAPVGPVERGFAGVTLRADQPDNAKALRPTVVTAATKLGQGRRAVAGMPTAADYNLPVLRDTAAGLALQIPNTPLPGKMSHQFMQPLSEADAEADAIESKDSGAIRFDVYSWSEGVLVAQADLPVRLSPAENLLDVPDALERLSSGFGTHRRLLLVLPVAAEGLPTGLNPHDAYIVVGERES